MVFLSLSVGLFSQKKADNKGVIFNQGTLAESLAQAKSNKNGPNLVFLDCYTTWCGPCKQMANVVFPMEHVGEFFNANFVNIKIDMEKGEGIELANKYNVEAYPTFLILDSDGNEINRVVGGGGADAFIAMVKRAMDPQNSPKVRLEAYLKSKNSTTAKAYLEALESSYMATQASTFIEEEFKTWDPKIKYSENLWKYVSQAFANPNFKILDFVIADKLTADNYIGKQRLDKAICNGLKSIASAFVAGRIKDADTTNILSKINYLSLLSTEDATASYFVEVPKLCAQNNIDQVLIMMKANAFMSLSEKDKASLEKFMIPIKGFTKTHLLEYLEAKGEYFKKIVEHNQELKGRI